MKFHKRFEHTHKTLGQVDVEIRVDSEDRGWYEAYDLETGGEWLYIEGVLEFSTNDQGQPCLSGYDGCFYLPKYIVQAVTSEGIIDDL